MDDEFLGRAGQLNVLFPHKGQGDVEEVKVVLFLYGMSLAHEEDLGRVSPSIDALGHAPEHVQAYHFLIEKGHLEDGQR